MLSRLAAYTPALSHVPADGFQQTQQNRPPSIELLLTLALLVFVSTIPVVLWVFRAGAHQMARS